MDNIDEIRFIGVDIAKEKLDLCLYNGDFSRSKYHSYTNNLDGFNELLSFIKSISDLISIRIGFEATSTYMLNLQKFLDFHKIAYVLINPKKLHHFIKYSLTESKTDKLDSYYIASYIAKLPISAFNSSFSQTKTLYKTYSAYVSMIIKTETHLKGLSDSILSDEFTSVTMRKEIEKLKIALSKTKNISMDELLEAVKVSMPEYDSIKNDLLGVGDKTLLAVLPLIYDVVDDYTDKQLQSFIGLNPVYKESGSSVKKFQHISKSGVNRGVKFSSFS